jgi:hypothetical protein
LRARPAYNKARPEYRQTRPAFQLPSGWAGITYPGWAGSSLSRLGRSQCLPAGPDPLCPGRASLCSSRLGRDAISSRPAPPPGPSGSPPGRRFLLGRRDLLRAGTPARPLCRSPRLGLGMAIRLSLGPTPWRAAFCVPGWAGSGGSGLAGIVFLAPPFEQYSGWARPGFPWPRPDYHSPGHIIVLLARLTSCGLRFGSSGTFYSSGIDSIALCQF